VKKGLVKHLSYGTIPRMKTFRQVLVNSLLGGLSTTFLWFSITFWAYLESKSVIVTSVISGAFGLFSAATGLAFGTFVDRHYKHYTMLLSSAATLFLTALTVPVYRLLRTSDTERLSLGDPWLWVLIGLIMAATVIGNLRGIALGTCVSLLVDEPDRERANGMVGAVNGVSFVFTSAFSGLAVGQLGMGWAIGISCTLTALTFLHLFTFKIPEDAPAKRQEGESGVDLRGAIESIRAVPGLGWLVALASFNNLLGGVFMSLMDAYGLELVRVEVWGLIFAFTSCGFVLGGILVSKLGLGGKPLHRLLVGNMVSWTVAAFFPVGASIIVVSIGSLIWLTTMPVIEAAEQTVLQRAVPFERQGRVFGFAQAVESASSPVVALAIGPFASAVTIPFMKGRGGDVLGGLLGRGVVGGLGLCFGTAGIIGLVVAVSGRFSSPYRRLEASLQVDPAA
jgi:MFS transporter, DHA3 family, multidrug efflux protein